MTTWLTRKSGSDSNGGTSRSVRSSGADAISNATAGLTLVTSITAAWDATDIGHGITVAGRNRVITAVTPQTTKTAQTSSASTTLQSAAQFDASMVGQAVTGPGIQPNTVITAFTDSSHVTMSIAAGAGFGTGTVTFYVKLTCGTGSGNFVAGTAQAWIVGGAFLTIGRFSVNANAGVTAGDTLYVGAGTYRETNAWTRSGSTGLPLSVIGDTDGAITGDLGEVVISNYLDDFKAPAGISVVDYASQSFITYQRITFYAGAAASPFVSTNSTDLQWLDCTIVNCSTPTTMVLNLTASVVANMLMDRCSVWNLRGGTILDLEIAGNSASTAYPIDLNVMIRNSFVFNGVTTALFVCAQNGTGPKVGGFRVNNCTTIGGPVLNASGLPVSPRVPCEVRNCFSLHNGANFVTPSIAFQIIEENNVSYGNAPAASQMTSGRNSLVAFVGSAQGLEFGQAFRLTGVMRALLAPSGLGSFFSGFRARVQGGSPNANLRDQQEVPPGSPSWRPPGLRLDTQTDQVPQPPAAPTVDFFGRQRPAAGGPAHLAAVGYAEFHDTAAQDSVLFDVGPNSAKFTGCGDQDFLVPVDAATQTISIRCNVGQAYAGGVMPSVTLLSNAEIGVAAQVVSALDGIGGTWQTITLAAITPTAAGFVKLRLSSFDVGAGQVNFDTFAVA